LANALFKGRAATFAVTSVTWSRDNLTPMQCRNPRLFVSCRYQDRRDEEKA